MSDAIPSEALSEHFQARLKGRRLVSALFTTFCFEPRFFETEVLPVFFDLPLGLAPDIKLLQLEDAIRSLPGALTVYYDRAGLIADGGGARLDVRRFPVHRTSGVFHPKNVLALVEDSTPASDGTRPRSLLCACMSANLTRAGWWESVEVAHVEEIAEGEHTMLRDDLIAFINALVTSVEGRQANDELREMHGAARDIHAFLKRTTQREHRSTDGQLWTQFDGGEVTLPSFISNALGASIRGLCLEVVSPYFDAGDECRPLQRLREMFEPREVRVCLPRSDRGEALCSEAMYEHVKSLPETQWGELRDRALLRMGKGDASKRRTIHAKVYRFFEPRPRGRELIYVGSSNLTTPGCLRTKKAGNWEAGFLVEVTARGRPDWWLTGLSSRPREFATRDEGEAAASSGGSPLVLHYRWDTRELKALWNDASASPRLEVRYAGVTVLTLEALPPEAWFVCRDHDARHFEETLRSSSLLEVVTHGREPSLILVQEEGMSHRPSILLDLSAADILRYWALLTVEQRAAFLDARARLERAEDPLLTGGSGARSSTSMFDRFAGIFHAFANLELQVRASLEKRIEREADYRLFGRKYDSLGALLERVLSDVEREDGDGVEAYVVMLCARQLVDELSASYAEYFARHRADLDALEASLGRSVELRQRISARAPQIPASFWGWFEPHFLKRAKAPDRAEDA